MQSRWAYPIPLGMQQHGASSSKRKVVDAAAPEANNPTEFGTPGKAWSTTDHDAGAAASVGQPTSTGLELADRDASNSEQERDRPETGEIRLPEDGIPHPFADARQLERLWAALERDPDYRPWWVIK